MQVRTSKIDELFFIIPTIYLTMYENGVEEVVITWFHWNISFKH